MQESTADKELVHIFGQGKKKGDADADFNHCGVGEPLHSTAQPVFGPGHAFFLLKKGEDCQEKTAHGHGGHDKMEVAGQQGRVGQVEEGAVRPLKIGVPVLGRLHQG